MWSNAGWQSDEGGWYKNRTVAGGGGFTPASLNSLLGWWKADGTVTVNNNGTGGTPSNGTSAKWIADASGNSRPLVADPTVSVANYNTSGLNGLPTISCIGATNQPFQASIPLANPTKLVVFGVFRCTRGTPSNDRFVSIMGSGDTTDYNHTTSCQLSVSAYGAGGLILGQNSANQATATITQNIWQQVGFTWDGTNATLYTGGSSAGSNANSNSFATPIEFNVGAMDTPGSSSAGGALIGDFAEVFVCNSATALTGTELTNIQTYFFNKWGV